MKLTRSAVILVLPMLSLALSCTSQQGTAPAKDTGGSKAAPQEEYGKLELLNVTTTPKIDSLTFRGTFRNPYDEPIENIRIVLRITQERKETAPILARAQSVLETKIEPGAHTPFEITAKINPKSAAGVGIFLDGFAVRRGDDDLPIPPIWQE